MSRPNKGYKAVVPQPGGEAFHEGEPGPLTYTYPMPPVRSRGRLLGAVETAAPGQSADTPPEPTARPLVPSSEEVATLPRAARAAFAARCAARVAPLRSGADSPEAAAALLLGAATTGTPIRRQLLRLRRDFDRIASLAKEGGWTDDTPVPSEAFGPLWPENLTPDWAKETNAPRPS